MLTTALCNAATTNVGALPAQPTRSDALSPCLPEGKPRTVEAKEHVFCEGDAATHVYRVEAGHVLIYRVLPDGRRHVINFAFPGDYIGLGAIREHAASAQAMARTRLKSFPLSAMHDCVRADSTLGLKLYEAVAEELAAAHDLLLTVSHRSASERVASFLVALSRRNRRRGENEYEIVLPMTRSDIADFLGLTIETVSRTFTKFRVEGLIDLEQCILVTIRDLHALETTAGGSMSTQAQIRLVS